ncbi:MAG TPA: signal peptidase I [Chitinivibrionales bacterium]|nr:signal peptidase I [Chitinivibrionales bacterium]
MDSAAQIKDRKKISALVAGLILPGLGQMYNGELTKGLCFFGLFLMTVIAGLRIVMMFPNASLMLGIGMVALLSLAIYIVFSIEAWLAASRRGKGFMVKWFNRWYFYTAMWMLCSVFISSAAFSYVSDGIVQFCRIVTASMTPAVVPGDYVIVDKTYYKHHAPKKGDVILFRYPDDRSKLFIKRIGGLPGDTLKLEGNVIIVPHGHVFALGDNAGHSDDSRHYGPIPLTELLGKARQVYFSFSIENGIRPERIGLVLP